MIGMFHIFRRATDLVHVANRMPRGSLSRKSRQDFGMLLRDIKPVEGVEQNKPVALSNQERLPVLP